jgi:hypothetical protein
VLGWLKGVFLPSTKVVRFERDKVDGRVCELLEAFRQGDLITGITEISVHTQQGPAMIETPLGVVVISQTCDLMRDNIPCVNVAERVQLSGGGAAHARKGSRPRYVHLPALGENDFADLSIAGAIDKSLIASLDRQPTVHSRDEIVKFGQAIGRNFSRFAFPDEISPYLAPFSDAILAKAGKLSTVQGRLIEKILQFRLQCLGSWDEPPFDLRLIVILEPTALPALPNNDDELPPFDEDLNSWLYDGDGKVKRTVQVIAEKLEAERDGAKLYWLWKAMADALIGLCKPQEGIADMTADVVSADEFRFTELDRSELLDLDYLSSPTTDRGRA